MGTMVLVESGGSVWMTTQPHLVPRLRMCRPTPPTCFHGVYVENYLSLHLNEETKFNKKKKILRLRFLIISRCSTAIQIHLFESCGCRTFW